MDSVIAMATRVSGMMPDLSLISWLTWKWPVVFLLLPVPWLIRRLLPATTRPAPALTLPTFDQARRLNQNNQQDKADTLRPGPLLAWLIWICLLAAAARPLWLAAPIALPTSGRDLMLAVDLSDSMRVADMVEQGQRVDRLSAVKTVVAEFIEAREMDRIGLILFGQHTFLQTPLTFDHGTVRTQLNESRSGFAGSSTAIGDAIAMAINRLRDRPAESRVLVLLTDGANTSGSDPVEAAAIAAEAGIRIHTVGIGATSLTVRDVTGASKTINPSQDLDLSTLATVARLTGGQTFRAHDPAEMKTIYQTIDALEPAPQPTYFQPQRSVLHWPLCAALFLTLLLLRRQSARE